MTGIVYNPNSANLADGILPANDLVGKQGEKLSADLHGKYFNAAMRRNIFKFNRTAVTVPVVAATLVSVFSLYNPPGSGVVAEIVSTEIGQVLATTVVDTLGWYFSSGSNATGATFTTPAVANVDFLSGRVGDVPAAQCVPYRAVTHVGTPVRIDMVAAFGAVTDAVVLPSLAKSHDGALIVPPGVLISLAMSTAAGTASGLDLGLTWAEWPFA